MRLAFHCAVGSDQPQVLLGLYFNATDKLQAYAVTERARPKELRASMLFLQAGRDQFVNYDHEWEKSIALHFETATSPRSRNRADGSAATALSRDALGQQLVRHSEEQRGGRQEFL